MMQITPELIVAISGLLAGLFGFWVNLRSARRDELERLGEKVESLERKYEREVRNKHRLMDYVAQLRRVMIEAGLQVPGMPILEDENDA